MMFGTIQGGLSARTMIGDNVWAVSGVANGGSPFGGIASGWEPPENGPISFWHHWSESTGQMTFLFRDALSSHVAHWVQGSIDGVGAGTAARLLGRMTPEELLKICSARDKAALTGLKIRLTAKSVEDLLAKVPTAPWISSVGGAIKGSVTSVRAVALQMGHKAVDIDRAFRELNGNDEDLTIKAVLERISWNSSL